MAPTPARASETVASRSYHVRRFTRCPPHQSTTRVPRNGSPRIADRSATRQLRRLRVRLRGLSVRAAGKSRCEQTRIEARDRDAELIERGLTDAERPSRLDVVSRDAPPARDDEEFHARGNVHQQSSEISEIPRVVVSGNEDGSAERNDDFLHVDAVSTQKVMNDK